MFLFLSCATGGNCGGNIQIDTSSTVNSDLKWRVRETSRQECGYKWTFDLGMVWMQSQLWICKDLIGCHGSQGFMKWTNFAFGDPFLWQVASGIRGFQVTRDNTNWFVDQAIWWRLFHPVKNLLGSWISSKQCWWNLITWNFVAIRQDEVRFEFSPKNLVQQHRREAEFVYQLKMNLKWVM